MTETVIMPGQHTLPPLPYPYDALEPVISEEALRIHHDRHHKAYVDGLNRAELALVEARGSNDYAYVKYWENQLAFNGSGHILHSIFWTNMAPLGAGGQPGIATATQIKLYFGDFSNFKAQFIEAAEKVEASGWAILVWHPAWRRLELLQCEKHQNLTQWSGIPILVCDVWEHAYYLDYRNRRREYLEKWWSLINWDDVERRLLLAFRGMVLLQE
ncbi:MAG TPA: superoxide dismutase [Thermoclostridium caenicola]|nr:superoxide dismutase [Thermoclostridium caenicola]